MFTLASSTNISRPKGLEARLDSLVPRQLWPPLVYTMHVPCIPPTASPRTADAAASLPPAHPKELRRHSETPGIYRAPRREPPSQDHGARTQCTQLLECRKVQPSP